MTALAPLANRSLAVAILAAAGGAAWLLVVEPVAAEFAAYHRTITQQNELLVRYLRIASARARLETELDELRQAQASTGRFLEGDSVELVAAALQNTVKNLVEANDATLKSTQILPANDQDPFRKVAIRVTMTADTAAWQNIIYGLETANPYLFLDKLDARSRRKRSRRGKSGSEDVLQIRFDVYGYMRIAKP